MVADPPGQGRRAASSSARCWPGRPASWSSWVRQEKPSARTTASAPASRTAGSSCCSAIATDTSWWPRSTPQLPASPQQPPSRVTRAPARAQQRRRRPTSPAPTRGGSAAGRRPRARPATAAPSRASRRAARRACGCRAATPLGVRAADQLERVAAQHRGARGLDADHRDAGVDQRAPASRRSRRGSARAASSWPVVIQVEPAAGVVAGHLHPVAGRLQHPDGGQRRPRARSGR